MSKPFTFALLFASAGLLLFGGRSVEAQVFSLDAATAPANGVFPDDLFPAPAPGPLPGTAILLGGTTLPAPPSDVDALSFGILFPGIHSVVGVDFSVAPGSIGFAGTSVFGESGGFGFADEAADIFGSGLGGGNIQVFDGDGIAAPGGAPPMGVMEPPGIGNTDAWDAGPLPPPGAGIYYSVTPADIAGHPAFVGGSAADIYFSPALLGYSVLPALFAPAGLLGLIAPVAGAVGDDIDALVIIDDAVGGFTAGDTIYFSLAPGSPTLAGLGASPADILVTTAAGIPSIAFPAAAIGLLASDDVDALHLFIIPEPSTFLLGVVGLFSLGWLAWRRCRRA